MMERGLAVKCVNAALKDLCAAVKAAARGTSPADAMDATLDRLRVGVRQSGAAVSRAKNTPTQDAARTQRFQQQRSFVAAMPNIPRLVRQHPNPDTLHGAQPRPLPFPDKPGLAWRFPDVLNYGETFAGGRPEDHLDYVPWLFPPSAADRARPRPAFMPAPIRRDLPPWLIQGAAAMKQAPGAIPGQPLYGAQPNIPELQASLRRQLAGSPGYVSSPPSNVARLTGRSLPRHNGVGIEPTPPDSSVAVGTYAPTALNWARYENKDQLRTMLGRKPTKEEKRAGMQVRRQLADEAGQPFAAMDPDNWRPSFSPFPKQGNTRDPSSWIGDGRANLFSRFQTRLDYPFTMTDPQQRYYYPPDYLLYQQGRPLKAPAPTPEEERAAYRRLAADELVESGRHPIHPNAQIRDPRTTSYARPHVYPYAFGGPSVYDNQRERFVPWSGKPPDETLNIDPRRPERYNRTLPPEKRMTQQQMDAIRQQYYQANPNLIPSIGQPGYDAWQRHIRRAEQGGTTKAARPGRPIATPQKPSDAVRWRQEYQQRVNVLDPPRSYRDAPKLDHHDGEYIVRSSQDFLGRPGYPPPQWRYPARIERVSEGDWRQHPEADKRILLEPPWVYSAKTTL